MDDDTIFKVLEFFFGHDLASADRQIRRIAYYRVPNDEDRDFIAFTHWINEGRKFIQSWRNDGEKGQAKYIRFMSGIDACRSGYAAASYHLCNLGQMENAIHAALEQFDFTRSIRPNAVASFGEIERCHYEYQAFVMAYRRSLDGFAWGISTYFSEQQSSFRKLTEVVKNFSPKPVAQAVSDACNRHKEKFAFVMAKERGKSVRDRLAHKEAVQAGTINVGSFGHRIIGGGENIGIANFAATPRIAEVLNDRLADHRSCISEILSSFKGAVELEEATPSATR